jgi:hypothetical protein
LYSFDSSNVLFRWHLTTRKACILKPLFNTCEIHNLQPQFKIMAISLKLQATEKGPVSLKRHV